MVHEDAPHGLGPDGQEVGLPLPLDPVLTHQPHVGLGDQLGGLKGVLGPLPPHEPPGDPAELVVDEGEAAHGGAIPGVQGLEDPGHFVATGGVFGHSLDLKILLAGLERDSKRHDNRLMNRGD